jgi:hypothetical protein
MPVDCSLRIAADLVMLVRDRRLQGLEGTSPRRKDNAPG